MEYRITAIIFRATEDGMMIKDFHKNCDNKGPTLTLLKV
jgi:hypothetical protein